MRSLLIILFLLIHTLLIAQVEKGNWIFAAGIMSTGYSQNTEEINFKESPSSNEKITTRAMTLYVSPSAGKFISDNFCLGVDFNSQLTFSSETGDYDSEVKYRSVIFSLGPFAEYYFGKNESGKPFVRIGAGYGLGNSKYKVNADYLSDNGYELASSTKQFDSSVQMGYAIFLNSVYMLKFYGGLAYLHRIEDWERSDVLYYPREHTINNIQIFLGVSISSTFSKGDG